MTVFDILSQMEAYAQAFPAMNTIISVMDRSLPYEAASGSYNTPEKSDVRYLVDEFLTSERGFSSVDTAGKTVLEIALDGDEIVSVDGSVRSGLVTYLMNIMESGGEIGKDMLRYFSGLATDTDEYALDDPVNGAEKVTVYYYSRPSGESSYTIEITGGSLQGTYKNITEEEMGWY